MLVLAIVLGVLVAFFAPVAIFLGTEFLKKFRFMEGFVANSQQMTFLLYKGTKAEQNKKPGMRNIVLRGSKPFCALVGFQLEIPLLKYSGFDYYGFVQSDEHGVAVISTYMGKGPCLFLFLVNMDLSYNTIEATSHDLDQNLKPNVTYPPHWYQRIGFYG